MFTKIGLKLCFVILLGSSSCGQESFSELMIQLRQEYARIVPYRLRINQIEESGDRFGNWTWVRERSMIGNHEVVAELNRDSNLSISEWEFNGRSGDLRFLGSQQGELSFVKIEPNEVFKFHPAFDWRTTGFCFCNDIGSRFEIVSKNIAVWDKLDPKNCKITRSKSEVIATFDPDIEITFKVDNGIRIRK